MNTIVRRLAPLAMYFAFAINPASALDESSTTKAVDTSRILSIGGDVTEILYALGMGDKIVAVDTTSLFPPEALESKRKVGYMRALSAEGVLSVAPSVILAAEGAGPPETVRALKASSVHYIVVPDTPTPDGVATKIRSIANAVE
ncbi:MAG: ABC transporter substrate-binding protein, partial [Pseudomonadota bacterium]